MSYLENEDLFIAEGDVVFTRGDQVLRAQSAKYNEKTGVVEVSGGLRLESKGDTLEGEWGIFNLKTNTGQVREGRLFLQENHYYLNGKVMEKLGPNTYRVKNCRLTTCDGERPAWSITGSEVEVTVEGYGEVRDTALRIRDFPIFYLPYAAFPVNTKRKTGFLTPGFGYSSLNGADVEIPFFWAINDQTDVTFYERYMTERGFKQGLEFRYVAENNSKGTFLFDILKDLKDEKDLSNPEEAELSPLPRTNETRYWLRSRIDQQLPYNIELKLDTDYVSDQDYLKEFGGGLFGLESRPDLAKGFGRPVEEIRSPTRRSALRLSRDKDEYSMQAASVFNQRPENPSLDDTSQSLAGLDFSLLPKALFDPDLFLKFDADYDYVWREDGIKGNRLSFSPTLTYPMFFGQYLQFEPSINYMRTTQWLDSDPQNIDQQSRDAYDLKGRMSTILERIYDFEWREAKAFKHKVTPSLTYEFREAKDQDRFMPWFEPIDVDGKINRITLELENLLDARREKDEGETLYRQWFTFTLSQPYSVDEARRDDDPTREEEPFEPLTAKMDIRPWPSFDIDAEAQWDWAVGDISFADLSLDLSVDRSGDREDKYEIDFQYEEDGSKALTYYLDINLFHGFSTGTSLKRDLDFDHTLESSYWLDYEAQCWGLRFHTGKIDEIENIMVSFRLLGLGEL